MDRRLQRQFDGLAGEQFNIQPSTAKGIGHLIILATGTNATGATNDVSDIGSCRITLRDDQIVNADYQALADLGDINHGSNLLNSTEASTFQASVVVPFNEPAFPSAIRVLGESELNFEHVPGDTGTVFDDLSIRVYAVYEDLPELYIYRMLRDNQNEDAAVDSKPYQLNRRNITGLYLKDVDEEITLIQLSQEGENVLSPQPYLLLEAATLYNNRLETSTFDRVKIETHTPGIIRSTVNRDTVISFTTGAAAAIEVLTTSMVWRSESQGRAIGRR